MMPRSFDAENIVVLPVLDVSSAITLGGEVLTAGNDVQTTLELPKAIKKSFDVVTFRHQALRAAAADRLGSGQNVDGTRPVRADRRLDGGWNGLFTWLTGWAKLPETVPQAGQANAILNDVFADGLRFLQLAYKQEWAESDTRLLRIASEKHDATIVALGGGAFIDEVRAAHAEYGEALGITKAPEKPDVAANLRDALNAFLNALRTYVVRVSAHVDEDDADSSELATRLLQPLTRWQSPKTSGGQPNENKAPASTPEGGETKTEG